MAEQKVNYLPLVLKEGKFSIKMSGKTEDVIKALKAITNDKGYFNTEIVKKKEPGKFGDTHYVKEDTWKLVEKAEKSQTTKEAVAGHDPSADDNDENSLPF